MWRIWTKVSRYRVLLMRKIKALLIWQKISIKQLLAISIKVPGQLITERRDLEFLDLCLQKQKFRRREKKTLIHL